jgi:hypothetical protein
MSDLREALKPCPFCGNQPRSRWFGATGEDDDSGYWGLECCQAFSHEDTEEDSARVWNTRAALAQPEAVEPVKLTYTNYRGETAERTIIPKSIRFGSTEWHPEPQWLLLALDVEKNADREFALKDFGPPLAPDERMRRALEKLKNEVVGMLALGEVGIRHAVGNTNVSCLQQRIKEAEEALSRADEGKESEGGPLNWQLSEDAKTRIAEIDANRRNAAINACNIVAGSPSDPTPPDATAQREAIARIISDRKLAERASWIQGFKYGEHYVVRDILLPTADQELFRTTDRRQHEERLAIEKNKFAADRILALSTRAGG